MAFSKRVSYVSYVSSLFQSYFGFRPSVGLIFLLSLVSYTALVSSFSMIYAFFYFERSRSECFYVLGHNTEVCAKIFITSVGLEILLQGIETCQRTYIKDLETKIRSHQQDSLKQEQENMSLRAQIRSLQDEASCKTTGRARRKSWDHTTSALVRSGGDLPSKVERGNAGWGVGKLKDGGRLHPSPFNASMGLQRSTSRMPPRGHGISL